VRSTIIATLMACLAAPLAAQATPLKVGDVAPDFAFRAATATGVATAARRLADFRGQTVVLAFFYRARTGG
jgi:peroxiredoxin Q/BCP